MDLKDKSQEQTMSASRSSSKKALWIMIAGFSVVFVANGFLVFFALNTWTGLETEQHYAKGLAYNTNLAAAKRQQALGWQAEMQTEFTNEQGMSGIIKVQFKDGDERPMTDLDVRVIASRPTQDGFDREFTMAHTGAGAYRGAFTLPLKGLWDFRILARRGVENYQRVERIETP